MSFLKNGSLVAALVFASAASAQTDVCRTQRAEESQSSSSKCAFNQELLTLTVSNTEDGEILKGDDLRVKLRFQNAGDEASDFQFTPRLSSLRFSDYSSIAMGTRTIQIAPGQTEEVIFELGHFFRDEERKKNYALGRGDYRIDLEVTSEGEVKTIPDAGFFTVGASNVVNVLVVYDPKYFEVGEGRRGRDPVEWIEESQSRAASVYNPESGLALFYPGGFQEMLGVDEVYQAFGNARFRESGGDPFADFQTAEAAAKDALGLEGSWISICSGTCDQHHGYDYMIALNPHFMGGVALSSGQVSGGFEFDQSQGRSQMVITHESGHVYGAPHCDPVQGFIMCSGEKAESYKAWGDFLWLEDSVKAMNPKKFE